MSMYDVVGLDALQPQTSVTIRHYYVDVTVEDDTGTRFKLDYVEINDDGTWSLHGRPFTKQGGVKGTYSTYLPRWNPRGTGEPITYKVINREEAT